MKTLLAMVAVLAVSACTQQPINSSLPSPTRVGAPSVSSPAPRSTPGSAAAPTPSSSPFVYVVLPVPPGTPRCRTNQLEVAFLGQGVAAGNVGGTFELRNKSATACWVDGYVGFQTLDQNRKPLPETLDRSLDWMFGRSETPRQILLPPLTAPLSAGADPNAPPRVVGHAFFNTATDDVMCSGPQLDAVEYLEIWPPDEYTAITISARTSFQRFVYCGGIGINPIQVRPFPAQS